MEVLERIAWALLPAIVVGIVLATFNRKQAKRDKHDQEMQDKRRKQDLLNLDLTVATAKLSYATAIALKRGYANGEVEAGVESYSKAMADLTQFEREQTVESLAQ